jgi:hypothetical protein
MSDLDDVLLRLRDAPVHPLLGSMEGSVLKALAARNQPSQAISTPPMALAAVAALFIGILAGVPGSREEGEAGYRLGSVPSLAPSALLSGK